MTPRFRLIKSLLVGLCLQALTGGTSASANLLLCCRSGPTVAGAISQVPPIQGGLARGWFLPQFEPGESLPPPIIPPTPPPLLPNPPGTPFFRHFSPRPF